MRFAAPDDLLVLVHWVDEHHASDLARVAPGEATHDESTVGLADEDVRWLLTSAIERCPELDRQLGVGARSRPRIAPAIAAAVVAANARELSDLGLDEGPYLREVA